MPTKPGGRGKGRGKGGRKTKGRQKGKTCSLVGRTLDLKAAYKQVAVSPEQGFARVLTAYDPIRRVPAFYIINALRFGATSAVYGFNRVAKSLWHIMVSLGGVWATQYFDDFPNVETTELATSSRSFMEFLLHALGWKYAMEGKKAEPYANSFKVLGVELFLGGAGEGQITVSNKRERIDDLVRRLGECGGLEISWIVEHCRERRHCMVN